MRLTEEEYADIMSRRTRTTTGQVCDDKRDTLPPQDKENAVQGKFRAFGEIPLESWEQVQVVNWIKSRGHKIHHSPNGGKRGKAEAGRFKSEGVSAGFPDLMCFSEKRNLPIIYIEMKRVKGGTITPEQKEWNRFLNGFQFSHNIKSFICKGHQEAIQLLVEHGY